MCWSSYVSLIYGHIHTHTFRLDKKLFCSVCVTVGLMFKNENIILIVFFRVAYWSEG